MSDSNVDRIVSVEQQMRGNNMTTNEFIYDAYGVGGAGAVEEIIDELVEVEPETNRKILIKVLLFILFYMNYSSMSPFCLELKFYDALLFDKALDVPNQIENHSGAFEIVTNESSNQDHQFSYFNSPTRNRYMTYRPEYMETKCGDTNEIITEIHGLPRTNYSNFDSLRNSSDFYGVIYQQNEYETKNSIRQKSGYSQEKSILKPLTTRQNLTENDVEVIKGLQNEEDTFHIAHV